VKFSDKNTESAESYTATVYAIEPVVDETTRTIRARAMYNGDHDFYPGSFVHVYVNLGETGDALMVPSQAVIPVLKGQKVFVSRNQVATEVPVKIGERTDSTIRVTEGLSAGDTIVTTGLMSVKKDSKLTLLNPAP
jgi:membrane fusion protein, multidrug efflux system